jgi:hypothetical protein
MAYHLPVLRIRCEWCKLLFYWHPRVSDLSRKGVRRTCDQTCNAKLHQWEKSRHSRSIHHVE